MTRAKCPRCGRIKAVQKLADMYRCGHCGALFDDKPDDSGPFSNDPVKNAMRREEPRRKRR